MNRVSESAETAPASTTCAGGGVRISISRPSSSARSSAISSSSSSCSSANASRAVSSIAPRSSASSRNAWTGVSKTVFRASLPSVSLSTSGCATALEALDAAAALGPALCAGVGGMTVRAHVDDNLVPRRARDEAPPARGAADSRERELRMDVRQGNRLLLSTRRAAEQMLARRRLH